MGRTTRRIAKAARKTRSGTDIVPYTIGNGLPKALMDRMRAWRERVGALMKHGMDFHHMPLKELSAYVRDMSRANIEVPVPVLDQLALLRSVNKTPVPGYRTGAAKKNPLVVLASPNIYSPPLEMPRARLSRANTSRLMPTNGTIEASNLFRAVDPKTGISLANVPRTLPTRVTGGMIPTGHKRPLADAMGNGTSSSARYYIKRFNMPGNPTYEYMQSAGKFAPAEGRTWEPPAPVRQGRLVVPPPGYAATSSMGMGRPSKSARQKLDVRFAANASPETYAAVLAPGEPPIGRANRRRYGMWNPAPAAAGAAPAPAAAGGVVANPQLLMARGRVGQRGGPLLQPGGIIGLPPYQGAAPPPPPAGDNDGWDLDLSAPDSPPLPDPAAGVGVIPGTPAPTTPPPAPDTPPPPPPGPSLRRRQRLDVYPSPAAAGPISPMAGAVGIDIF